MKSSIKQLCRRRRLLPSLRRPEPNYLPAHTPSPTFFLLGRFGYAYFETLRIKQAGIGYRLGFNATGVASEFEGTDYVESEAFTVGVGPAYRLELENDIFAEAIVSSSPFKEQVWYKMFASVLTLHKEVVPYSLAVGANKGFGC